MSIQALKGNFVHWNSNNWGKNCWEVCWNSSSDLHWSLSANGLINSYFVRKNNLSSNCAWKNNRSPTDREQNGRSTDCWGKNCWSSYHRGKNNWSANHSWKGHWSSNGNLKNCRKSDWGPCHNRKSHLSANLCPGGPINVQYWTQIIAKLQISWDRANRKHQPWSRTCSSAWIRI